MTKNFYWRNQAFYFLYLQDTDMHIQTNIQTINFEHIF